MVVAQNYDVYFAWLCQILVAIPVQSNDLCPQMVFYQQCNCDN